MEGYHDKTNELSAITSDHIDAMVAYWDKDLICRFANNAYLDWFGKSKDQMINKMSIDVLLGDLYPKNLPYVKGALSGSKQLFEREIPIPGTDKVRHSLATYTPDIKDNEVLGFFVHVADVSHLKKLEKEIADEKRETLRKIIEVEENQKKEIVNLLKEGINQKFAACNMILSGEKSGDEGSSTSVVALHIREIVQELNLLCQDLAPSGIELLGLIDTLQYHQKKLGGQQNKLIEFKSHSTEIEKISLTEKIVVFRLIQNLSKIAVDSSNVTKVFVLLEYQKPYVNIKLEADGKVILDKTSKDYHEIVCRVDYFAGDFAYEIEETKTIYEIKIDLSNS